MNPAEAFCPNIDCAARGQTGEGNISVHSQQEKRYQCEVCDTTFAATKGTLFYRLRTDPKIVMLVITLLAYPCRARQGRDGCPRQAIVAAFGLHERTVQRWWRRAGERCHAIHAHVVGKSQLDLQQVQADEIKVKTQRGTLWMAMAMMVPTRLWLGGVISAKRDKELIRTLAEQIRAVALARPLLLAVDGLASYVDAFRKAFRSPLPRRGPHGRPQLLSWPDIAIVQVVKQRAAGKLTIDRRIVQGAREMITQLIDATQGRGMINTAYIERLNATFRQRLSCLARRTRHLAQQAETLAAGMFVVGCFYNFCDYHKSLRLRLSVGSHGYRWVQRTPALAASVTDHCWSIAELLHFKVPPPCWTSPKRRGPPSRETLRLMQRWCT